MQHSSQQTKAQENTLGVSGVICCIPHNKLKLKRTLGVSEALSNLSLSKKDAVAEFLRNSNLEDYISRVIAYG